METTKKQDPKPGEIWRSWSGQFYITATNHHRSAKYEFLGKKKLDSDTTYKLTRTGLIEKIGTFELDTVATATLRLTPREVRELKSIVRREEFPELWAKLDELR